MVSLVFIHHLILAADICVSFLSIIFTEVLVAPSKSVQTTLSSPQTPCPCPSIVPSQDLPIKL